MTRQVGFTLLEVVVATALLAVGVLGLLSLQAQSLHVQQRVRVVRELVGVAEGELSLLLSTALPSCTSCPCSTFARGAAAVSRCEVRVESCSTSLADNCNLPSRSRATLVSVTLASESGQEFELRALQASFPAP